MARKTWSNETINDSDINGTFDWAAYETNPMKLSVKAMTTAALAANTATASTLTANSNGAFGTIDGQTINLNDIIWVNYEASPENNGPYELTDAGSGGTPSILTRPAWLTTDAMFLAGLVFYVRAGTVHGGKYFCVALTTPTGTIATDSLKAKALSTQTRSVPLTDAATIALDASLGTSFRCSSAVDRTLGIPTNPTTDQRILIAWKNTAGVTKTLTLTTGSAGAFRFGSDITGTTATAAGKQDYLTAVYNLADDRWDVIDYKKGY